MHTHPHTRPLTHIKRYALCALLSALYTSTTSAATKIEAQTVTLSTISNLVSKIKPEHPSLFGRAADFERVRLHTLKTEYGKLALERLIRSSDFVLTEPCCERKKTGRRLLGVCRRSLYRVTTLGMTYRLTGDKRYFDRCKAELLAAADFSDWNPSHYLDVAEMTLAMAIGYDWLYNDLDPESREKIYKAIYEKAFNNSQSNNGWWIRTNNNWGQVCHAGMMAGALATIDRNPGVSSFIIHRAIKNLPTPMHAFTPKGAYPEGPGYWTYGTNFNVLALDMLFDHFGTDFGLSKLPGFEETIDYMNIVTGPSGETFNYADGGSGRSSDPTLWWFADHFKRPDILKYYELDAFKEYCKADPSKKGNSNRLWAIGMLWFDDVPADIEIKTPLHWSSDSKEVITVHRTGWDNSKDLFAGFKGGTPSANHGHMDAGSFVLDYAGIRWAKDLGAEGYNGIESRGMNLWNSNQDSDRWKIFRLSNLSHNTLVIDGQLQLAKGRATLKSFKPEPHPETVLDLTGVYKGQATLVERSGKLLPTGEFQISDKLEGLKPGAKVRWQMMTTAKPGTADSPVVTLLARDKKLKLSIKHDNTAQWKIIDAEKPQNEWDSPNANCKLIAFETIAPENGKLDLSVLITPGG